MAEIQKDNIFSSLRRLFSTDVIIRRKSPNGGLDVIDPSHVQTNGVIQNNSLVDRFNKIYTTSTAFGLNLNLSQNYQSSRLQIYTDYDSMDLDAICSSVLDILSDECTLSNDNGKMLEINSADENIQEILEQLFYSTLNIEYNLWAWIRNMCKYGDFYLKMEISEQFGVYNVIPFSSYNIVRQEGFNPENPNEVRFKFDPYAAMTAVNGYMTTYNNSDPGIWFDNYEMAHFRLIGDVNYLPYGRSYLEPARRLFKQYTLIEDAMLIHRIVRAPDKRAYYLNVGNIPPGEVENYVQRFMMKMKKTPLIDPSTGQYNMKYNEMNLLEDYVIPHRGNTDSTKIETIGGLNYDGIQDVQYFREKLFAALKVPKAFLGFEKDLSGRSTLSSQDIRFSHTIERLQKIVVSELKKIAIVHLYALGYTDDSMANFSISLTNPSIIYQQEKIQLLKEKIDLLNAATETSNLPREYLWKNIFNISEDEFAELNDMIIEDQKNKFRYKQIQEEGNDPVETGQAFGTPHQIASLYGGKGDGSLDVPKGYNEKNPDEPVKMPGRPEKNKSLYGKDASNFGRDRLGKEEMKPSSNAKIQNTKDSTKKPAIFEDSSQALFQKYKKTLEKAFPTAKKVLLYEEPDVLNEKNIIEEQ